MNVRGVAVCADFGPVSVWLSSKLTTRIRKYDLPFLLVNQFWCLVVYLLGVSLGFRA